MQSHGIYLLCSVIFHSAAALLLEPALYSVLFQNKRNDKNSDKLLVHGDRAFVGGTNYFLAITFTNGGNATDVNRVSFESTASNYRSCKTFSKDHCENTVRVIEVMYDESLLLCGTNSEGPKCFYYNITNSTFKDADLDANTWLTKSPSGSTTSLYMGNNGTDSALYLGSAGTKAKTGVFCKKKPNSLKSNINWLNAPEFMGTYSLGRQQNKVYIFFNEKSTNFLEADFTAGNRKNDYYSMVARVCKSDNGGSWEKDTWVTFTKARLLCPWPGEDLQSTANLFYNELVATFSTQESVIGIFRTMRNWNLTTYAICKFGSDDIDATLEGRLFEGNTTKFFKKNEPNNAVSFAADADAPFIPGNCPASSEYKVNSNFEQFVHENTLVKMNILPKGRKAFFVTSNGGKFKFILAQTFSWCTVIYLLTEDGTMTKLTVDADMSTKTLFNKQLGSENLGIISAKLMEKHGVILATTEDQVVTIPVQFCSTYKDCRSCNLDPHCHWEELATHPFFECREAVISKLRTCSHPPGKPENLSASVTDDTVQIFWNQDGVTHITSNVVTIKAKKNDELVYTKKIDKNSVTIRRSILEDGGAFEVVVQSLNESSLSAKSTAEFLVSLQKPEPSYSVGNGGVIELKWSQIPGADRYLMKLLDSSKAVLQEFIFAAKQENLYFYLSNISPNKPYTVTVTAVSADGVQATGELDFTSPGQKVTEPLKDAKTEMSSCSGFISALIVFVALFLGSLFIILHNNFTIKPNVNVLRNDNGCSYKRRHLLIWRKENGRQTHLNCEDTVVSSTSA